MVTESTPLHNFYTLQDLVRTFDMSHFANYPLEAAYKSGLPILMIPLQ